MTLASRADGPGGPGADGNVNEATISADGRHVAFESDADNLSAADGNAFANVFVRDLQAATTTLVSRSAGAAGAGGDGGSGEPAVSADGRYVAFLSTADNLSAEDDDAGRRHLPPRRPRAAAGLGADARRWSAHDPQPRCPMRRAAGDDRRHRATGRDPRHRPARRDRAPSRATTWCAAWEGRT